MSSLLPVAVAVPILTAVLTVGAGVRFSKSGWYLAALGALVHLAVAGQIARLAFARAGTPVTYAVGGFQPPFGIELAVDGVSATILLLVSAVALGLLAYVRRAGPRGNAFFAQYLLLLAGLTGMTVTGDVFNLYVFLEITGLAAYALVASGDTGGAAIGALKYLVVGTVGASLYLLGVGYAFVATGTLNMADLSAELAAVGYDATLVQASFALVVVGLAVKTALFPLHTWQPAAYANAPDSVSALISALVSTVSAYALARIVFSVFTVDFFAAVPAAQTLVVTLACVSVVAGSVLAVTQSEIKRMLAYSSVAQFGLVVAAIGVATGTALVGSVVHLVGHALMKGGLFAAAGAIATVTGARHVDEYAGLGRRRPVLAGAFAVLSLAMVGVPPGIGFIGKWYIALGAVQAGAWPVAAVVLASTLLTLAYFARLVERMYFREVPAAADERGPHAVADGSDADANADVGDEGEAEDGDGLSPGMVAVVVVVAVLVVALGLFGETFAQLLQPTVEVLLNP